MDDHQAIMDVKTHFDSLYDDVAVRGSGRAEFVVIHKHLRSAVVSVADDNKGWFVELWTASDLTPSEEKLFDERVVESPDDAINRICEWLDG